jgi:hypothetical protein
MSVVRKFKIARCLMLTADNECHFCNSFGRIGVQFGTILKLFPVSTYVTKMML